MAGRLRRLSPGTAWALLAVGALVSLLGGFALARGGLTGLPSSTSWTLPADDDAQGLVGSRRPGVEATFTVPLRTGNLGADRVILRTGPSSDILELAARDSRLTLTLIGPADERLAIDLGPAASAQQRQVQMTLAGHQPLEVRVDRTLRNWWPALARPPTISLAGLEVDTRATAGPVRLDVTDRSSTRGLAWSLLLVGLACAAAGAASLSLRQGRSGRTHLQTPVTLGLVLLMAGGLAGMGVAAEPESAELLTVASSGVAERSTSVVRQPFEQVAAATAQPHVTIRIRLDITTDGASQSTTLARFGECDGGDAPCPGAATVALAGSTPTFTVPIDGQPTPLWIGEPLAPGDHRLELSIESARSLEIFVDSILLAQIRLNEPLFLPGSQLGVFVEPLDRQSPTGYLVASSIRSDVLAGARHGLDVLAWWACLALITLGTALVTGALVRRVVPEPADRALATTVRMASAVVAGLWTVALVIQVTQPQPTLPGGPAAIARNTPFFWPAYRFSDFFQPLAYSGSGDPYTLANSNYPPFGNVVLWPLHGLPERLALAIFLGLTIGTVIGIVLVSLRVSETRTGLLVPLPIALSCPMLFAADRGNIDLLVAPLVLAAAVVATRRQWWSGLAIGVAGALKLFPLVLAVPLVRHRGRVRASAGVLVGFAVATLLSLPLVGVTSLPETVGSLANGATVPGGPGITASYTTSANGMLLATGYFAPGWAEALDAWLRSSWWLALRIAVAGTVLLWVLLVERRAWRGWMVAALAVLLAPDMSAAYHAVILAAPLVVAAGSRETIAQPRSVGALLGVGLAPVAFWYSGTSTVSTASLLVPASLICLLVLLVRQGLVELIPAGAPLPRRTRRLAGAVAAVGGLGLVAGMGLGVRPVEIASVEGASEGVPRTVPVGAAVCPERMVADGTRVSGAFTWNGLAYASVFSTAPGNEGLRMEVAPDGSVGALVPGEVVPQGVYLRHRIRAGTGVTFEVRYEATRLEVTVGDETVARGIVAQPAACNLLRVGAGYSPERDFDGPVQLRMTRVQQPTLAARTFAMAGFLMMLLASVVLLSGRARHGTGRDASIGAHRLRRHEVPDKDAVDADRVARVRASGVERPG